MAGSLLSKDFCHPTYPSGLSDALAVRKYLEAVIVAWFTEAEPPMLLPGG